MLASNFDNLAPALVFVAEMDPLRDEGNAYAGKLKDAGALAELVTMPGAPHLFAALDGILDSGKLYNEKVIGALKREVVPEI